MGAGPGEAEVAGLCRVLNVPTSAQSIAVRITSSGGTIALAIWRPREIVDRHGWRCRCCGCRRRCRSCPFRTAYGCPGRCWRHLRSRPRLESPRRNASRRAVARQRNVTPRSRVGLTQLSRHSHLSGVLSDRSYDAIVNAQDGAAVRQLGTQVGLAPDRRQPRRFPRWCAGRPPPSAIANVISGWFGQPDASCGVPSAVGEAQSPRTDTSLVAAGALRYRPRGLNRIGKLPPPADPGPRDRSRQPPCARQS